MPEGPEVKNMVLHLNKFLSGKTLHQIVIHSGRYSKKNPDNFSKFIEKLPLKIIEVRNKGKFIWFQFEGGWTMWNTLGMTGGWKLEKDKHSHCEFILDNDKSLWFNDIRNFGTIKFCNNVEDFEKKIKSLGPDILEDEFTLEIFESLLKQNKLKEKTLPEIFMNQKYLSGLGNYLKSEILYESKISPFRKLGDITDSDIQILYKNIKKISLASLKAGGATIRNYSNINNEKGKYVFEFKVYQQKKDPLGNIVKKIDTKDKRTTHWVPEVQI
jgi:formamidopyrimidine-DNA glycosylase